MCTAQSAKHISAQAGGAEVYAYARVGEGRGIHNNKKTLSVGLKVPLIRQDTIKYSYIIHPGAVNVNVPDSSQTKDYIVRPLLCRVCMASSEVTSF